MTRALLQQALDALTTRDVRLHESAAEAIRAELAKPEQVPGEEWFCQSNIESFHNACQHKNYCLQLKAQPAQDPRQWVGLTERERDGITRSIQGGYGSDTKVAFAIEAALREKNAAQPAPEPRPPNCGTGHCSCIECHDPAYRAMVRGEAQPAQEPLTDAQIEDCMKKAYAKLGKSRNLEHVFARTIEAAHGIVGKA